MKTIAISTFGWPEWECDAFEQYVTDVAADFYANVTITHTADLCIPHHLGRELTMSVLAILASMAS